MASLSSEIKIVLDDDAKEIITKLNNVVDEMMRVLSDAVEKIDKLNKRLDSMEGDSK